MQRPIISCSMLEESPQTAEAAAKIPTPRRKIKRRPQKSPSAPPTRIRAERNSPYPSTTHCTSTTVAWNADCRAGKATFTTVLSMKAMLEPRMAAAIIQGPASGAHGLPELPDRIKASSHGGFIQAVDESGCRWDSEAH